jgi:hypothetical protein
MDKKDKKKHEKATMKDEHSVTKSVTRESGSKDEHSAAKSVTKESGSKDEHSAAKSVTKESGSKNEHSDAKSVTKESGSGGNDGESVKKHVEPVKQDEKSAKDAKVTKKDKGSRRFIDIINSCSR